MVAGVRLPARIVRSYLRDHRGAGARPLAFERGRPVHEGGHHGYNGHYANGLTALFIACGQDVANVANSAVGIT